MAIVNQNDLINARINKRQNFSYNRASIGNMVAGALCAMYRSTGPLPAQPIIPTASAVPTKALTFNFNNPAGADKTYIDVSDGNSSLAGRCIFGDRLYHSIPLNGTVITAQTVNSQSNLTLPLRGAQAGEAEWFLEWYADTGATAVNATVAVTYTDTTTSNIVIALAATMRAGRRLPIAPIAGKIIASIQSVLLSATTGAAGSFGVTAFKRFAGVSLAITTGGAPLPPREAILYEVPNDACIEQMVECSTTASGVWSGEFTLIQG